MLLIRRFGKKATSSSLNNSWYIDRQSLLLNFKQIFIIKLYNFNFSQRAMLAHFSQHAIDQFKNIHRLGENSAQKETNRIILHVFQSLNEHKYYRMYICCRLVSLPNVQILFYSDTTHYFGTEMSELEIFRQKILYEYYRIFSMLIQEWFNDILIL